MNDTKKKLMKIAGILVLVGLAMFWAAMVIMKFDFNRLSTMKFETNTHEVEEDFDNISIEVETAEVTFVPSEDGNCKVVCEEPQRVKHSVEVQNGTLKIRSVDERKWYDYIGIGFWETSVIVYLPKDSYEQLIIVSATGDIEMPDDFSFEDVNITASTAEITWYASVEKTLGIYTSTGDISVEDISADEINLSASTGHITLQSVCANKTIEVATSTGKIKLNDVTCENIDAGSSTGDIALKKVVAKDGICAGTSTGDVEFDGSDAEWISVNTTTGDVSGTLLSDKIFMVDTSTGKIEVPKTTTGGKCEIETNTGDIELSIR